MNEYLDDFLGTNVFLSLNNNLCFLLMYFHVIMCSYSFYLYKKIYMSGFELFIGVFKYSPYLLQLLKFCSKCFYFILFFEKTVLIK